MKTKQSKTTSWIIHLLVPDIYWKG